MNRPTAPFHLLAALILACLAPAQAGGVRDIPLTSIPMARSPITVDGSLNDWPDTRPVKFVPIDPGLTKSDSPVLNRLRRHPASASIQAAYDRKALYLGIVWQGPPHTPGNTLELHVRTDRMAHILIAPVSSGRAKSILLHIGGGTPWRETEGIVSVTTRRADGTQTQEVRLPWSVLSKSSEPPASLGLAADFFWPDLAPATLRALPTAVRHDNTHLTACFLTSPAKLFGRDNYLGSPSDWGTLTFADGFHPNTTQVSPLATGATGMYASRVPRPLTMDGSLAGWKPAQFQSVVYAPGYLEDRYSAKIATAYDADNLYIAAHVQSPGGPLNTAAEATQAGFAGGDCLQVRLSDGPQTVNLCAWYDSVYKTPALTADGNDLPNPFLRTQGAREVFRKDPDGGGYTQEIALPWRLLPAGAAPKPGDTWKATFQVWWAGTNAQFTALAAPTLAPGGGLAYTYRLPQEASVSLGVYDAQGHLVRMLVKDARRRAGRNTDFWDGKDQFGSLVTPGRYQVRGVFHPPITVQPVVSVGNPGTPPWPTADGRGDWISDEASPQGAATDGTNVYLAAPGSEKGHAIIAVGPDGRRLWGYQESAYPRCVSLAVSGGHLYALFSGPETVGKSIVGRAFLVCLDAKTGAPALFSTQKPEQQIATWPYVDHTAGLWDLRTHQAFTPLTYEGQTRYFANDVGEATEGVGIAATADRLYVSMLTQNQVLVLDARTGQPLDAIPVPHPVGLYGSPDGQIIGISDGKVVSIDPASKSVTTLIDHDLAAPHDVTTDRAGNLYVSDWGASFQVKVFSPRGGLLRAIGTPGGRPWVGPWDPNGMLLPRGVAVTDDGKLWVAEDDAAPNRVSVWNAATGALIRDYIGPAPYGGGGGVWVDPADPTRFMGEGTLFHVDDARKAWTPVATPYRRLSENTPFTPSSMFGGAPGTRTLVHDGHEYVFWTSGSYQMVVLRRDGNRLTPVAALGCRGRYITTDGTQEQIWDSDIGYHRIPHYFPDFFAGHSGDNYIWTDKNGDGQVQADEMQWVPTLTRGDTYVPGRQTEFVSGWGWGFAPDGSLYLNGFCRDRNVVSRLALRGWTPGGAPIYDLAAARPVVITPSDEGVQGLCVDDAGHLLVTRPYEWNKAKRALDCYDLDGHPLWSIAAPQGQQQANDFLADNIIGVFHEPGGQEVLASWLWHANYKPYLLTSDGLYLTSLLDDTRLGPTATWDESYKNYFQAPDGSAYIINGANDTYNIDKIVGLDRLHRFTGAITVTAADLQAAASVAVRSASAPPPPPQPVIGMAWHATPPTIDGDLSDWDMSRGVVLRGSKGRAARVALARDADTLYLAYDVHGARLVNKGGNWQTLFISGDCADLMLHVGPYQPHFTPAEGDERLLLSVFQGHPVAVLYRPVVPGTASPTRLMGAAIDQIVRLPSARIAYRRSADGYTLEAAVPFADLGIDPAATDTLRGDVGVIYADETGANRSLRLYYDNHDTAMTADLTTEATLQPGNWGDIALPLGPNLLKNGDFEKPLAPTPDTGWAVTAARNGAAVALTDSAAFSGSRSLLMQQTTPVTFPESAYALPDYGAFQKAANGGQGGGYAEVSQRVPVTGGHAYALRFRLRALDFPGGEKKDPGPNRGYVSLEVWVRWEDNQGNLWVLNRQDSSQDWLTFKDARFNYYSVPVPYAAPPGATAALLQFSLVDNFAGRSPKVYLDDVEWVEAGK